MPFFVPLFLFRNTLPKCSRKIRKPIRNFARDEHTNLEKPNRFSIVLMDPGYTPLTTILCVKKY